MGILDQHYIYYPEPWVDQDWKEISHLPLEDIWVTTEDGERIHGWFVAAENSRATILWCHGNAGNISHRLENLIAVNKLGYSVFIFDYRGYGRSSGKPSEAGLYQDALAAYKYLVTEIKVDPNQLILFGRSLGSAVIGEVALKNPAAGLILETPFPSVEAVVRVWYGMLPLEHMLSARFDLAKRVAQIQIPVLVIHGHKDTIIPFELGRRVFEQAQEPKRFYRIPGADHNNTYHVGGEDYFREFARFIEDNLERR